MARESPAWLAREGIDTESIAPGKPWQDGTNESLKQQVSRRLNMEWFRNRAEAKVIIETCGASTTTPSVRIRALATST